MALLTRRAFCAAAAALPASATVFIEHPLRAGHEFDDLQLITRRLEAMRA